MPPYTLGCLDNTIQGFQMALSDTTHLVRTCLSPAQFLHFELQLRTVISKQAQNNQDSEVKNIQATTQEMSGVGH